jgi:hypothetical protein
MRAAREIIPFAMQHIPRKQWPITELLTFANVFETLPGATPDDQVLAIDWRDFVFAALESGINAFEIGHTSVPMLAGVAEAFAAMERRLFVVSWRTSLSGGALETSQRVRELANAMLLSAWTDETISLPLNGARYAKLLNQKAAASARRKPKKVVASAPAADFSKSFAR